MTISPIALLDMPRKRVRETPLHPLNNIEINSAGNKKQYRRICGEWKQSKFIVTREECTALISERKTDYY